MSDYGENVESVERKRVGDAPPDDGELHIPEFIYRVERTDGSVDFFRQKGEEERVDATKKDWDAIKVNL